MTFINQFAAESAGAKSDLFTALGIDWRLLILQIIAFLILVYVLGRFVYPWLMKSVDDRQKNIELASQAAAKAQKAAEANQEQVIALLDEARKQATEIVSTAKLESSEMLTASEKKAQNIAERIVADARDQLGKDIENARKMLYNDTLDLVGLATEKIIGIKLDKKADNELIASAVEASK